MAAAVERGDEAALLAKLQRNLNQVLDSDRSTRRRGLQALRKALVDERVAPADVCGRVFVSHFYDAVLRVAAADPVEKCRELAIGLVSAFAAQLEAETVAGLAERTLAALTPRYGTAPFAETSEELRLALLEATTVVLTKAAASSAESGEAAAEAVAPAVAAALADSFPDAKRAAAKLARRLAEVSPKRTRLHCSDIAIALVTNLAHQHAATRGATLEALACVIGHCADSDGITKLVRDTVLRALHVLTHDRSASVRLKLVTALESLVVFDNTALSYFDADLVALLVDVVADPVADVSVKAVAALDAAGKRWVAEDEGSSALELTTAAPPMPHADASAPADADAAYLAARGVGRAGACLVTAKFGRVLGAMLPRADHWTTGTRQRGLQALAALAALVRPPDLLAGKSPQLGLVFGSLSRDDEAAVRSAATAASRALGAALEPDAAALFESLLARGSGDAAGTGVGAAAARAEALHVVQDALSAMGPQRAAAHAPAVADALAKHAEKMAEERAGNLGGTAAAEAALLGCCDRLIAAAPKAVANDDEACARVCKALLLSSRPHAGLVQLAAAFAVDHSESAVSAEAIPTRHFRALVAALPACDQALLGPAHWALLEALVRVSPLAAAQHFDAVAPALIAHAAPATNPDAEARISCVALVHALVKPAAAVHDLATADVRRLVDAVVAPNLVWSAGRVPATLRKAALAVLHALLGGSNDEAAAARHGAAWVATFSNLVPVLRTNLDDYDTSARELSIACLSSLLAALPSQQARLDDAVVTALYPALLKRLDDSADHVRLQACRAFVRFVRACAPGALQGTALEFSTEQFLVHLDDALPDVQDAVFEVLKELLKLDDDAKSKVKRKITEVRASHRSPAYCDRLLEIAGV
ncbi:armadillo-type protein [Pelagophyceae sp. CCMP2097]|nr:armadillo-type protein [Pelagophyceae sp. CCMP2097]